MPKKPLQLRCKTKKKFLFNRLIKNEFLFFFFLPFSNLYFYRAFTHFNLLTFKTKFKSIRFFLACVGFYFYVIILCF